MNRRRIEKIALTYFRGATTMTEICFDPRKPLTFIFGENGTGKSSIVDAIDFVCNRSAGSLEDRRLSTRAKEFLPAIGTTAKDLRIEITINGSRIAGVYAGAKIQIAHEVELPVAHILRRSRLLNLIEAPASERYKQLQSFIDVEGVERSEQALRDALNEAKRTFDEKTKALTAAAAELKELWEAEGAPGDSAMVWAKTKTSVPPERAAAAAKQLQTVVQRLDEAIRSRTTHQQDLADAMRKESSLLAMRNEAASAQGLNARESLELLDLLSEAKSYLVATPDLPSCPLCEQPVVAAELRRKIDERLSGMIALDMLRDRLDAATREHQRAADIAEKSNDTLTQSTAALAASCQQVDLSALAVFAEIGTAEPMKMFEILAAAREDLMNERDAWQKDVNQFNSIRVLYQRVSDCWHEVGEIDRLRQRLERTLEIVQAKRIAFTQAVLDQVRDECNRLYALIHPDEPVALGRLYLDQKRKASLEQRCRFEDQDNVIPQAYFSESHLDTLGFCLWLSVVKLAGGSDAVVILDDIFTSVDDTHLNRLLDLLTAESASFNQIIVTTHHRLWLDRYAEQELLPSVGHFIELRPWSRKHGIQVTPPQRGDDLIL